jgi:hypothetical protein
MEVSEPIRTCNYSLMLFFYAIYSNNNTFIHSFIQYSVWRQVQSLHQNDSST